MAVDIQIDQTGIEGVKFSGSQINYYFVCKRKLWLYSHNVELEVESDLVKLGRLLHENRYNRKLKEVGIDRIKVDFMESRRTQAIEQPPQDKVAPKFENPDQSVAQKEIIVHEVKRSKKLQDAHLYQLLYYMYYLKRNYGVNISRGVLHYPMLKQNVDVPLTREKIAEIEEALKGIVELNSQPNPPEPVRKGYCRNCAYQELCFG